MRTAWKLLINGSFIGKPVTGTQRFGMEVSKELLRRSEDVGVILPVGVDPPNWLPEDRVLWIPSRKASGPWRRFSEWVTAPLLIARRFPKVAVWSPSNVGPPNYKRHIVTIHDMAIRHNPSWFSRKFALYYRIMFFLLIKRGATITTVSKFSRDEIKKYYKISTGDVLITPNGVADVFSNLDNSSEISSRKIVLSVASKDPRKRVGLVIEAWKSLPEEVRKKHNLVLVGGASQIFGSSAYDQDAGVMNVGRVSDEELKNLYFKARVVVLASEYEGFGLPIIEALACGAPVLCSDIPAFREVGGTNVSYFSGHSPSALASALQLAIDNSEVALPHKQTSNPWGNAADTVLKLVEAFER